MQVVDTDRFIYVRFFKITRKDRLEIFFKKGFYAIRRFFTKENVPKSSVEET